MTDSETRMTRTAMLAAALLATVATPVVAQTDPVAAAADAALTQDRYAWDFVEGVTTEVGPRQAGTEAEKRGRDKLLKVPGVDAETKRRSAAMHKATKDAKRQQFAALGIGDLAL